MSDAWKNYMDPFEDAPLSTPREIFARRGYHPVAPEAMDESLLPGRMWEMIYAMAACRFFLVHTDHLSDAELYDYLYHDWLDEPTADVPPEAGWNCHVDLSMEGGDDVWLRYYADEVDRRGMLSEHPDYVLPPQEEPPYERDQWLPEPPHPVAWEDSGEGDDAEAGAPDGGMDTRERDGFGGSAGKHVEDTDPLGLRAVEAAIHKDYGSGDDDENDDEEDAENVFGGGPPDGDGGDDGMPGDGRWARPVDLLPEFGVNLLPPPELTDEALSSLLWEVLHVLACLGVYLKHTDHMSERELYAGLWQSVLREESYLPCSAREAAWTHDFIGGGSEEDEQVWLACYASDVERQRRAEKGMTFRREGRRRRRRDWRLPLSPLG